MLLRKKWKHTENFVFCTGRRGRIAQGVFFYNQSLTNLTLPHSIQVLEADAFSDTALRDIYYDGTQADWNAIAKKVPTGGNVEQPFREFYAEMHYLRENTSTETTAAITIQTTTESTEGTSQTTSEITTSIPVSTATTTQEQRTSTESKTCGHNNPHNCLCFYRNQYQFFHQTEVPADALYGDIDLDGKIAINDAVPPEQICGWCRYTEYTADAEWGLLSDSSSGTIDMQDAATSLLRFWCISPLPCRNGIHRRREHLRLPQQFTMSISKMNLWNRLYAGSDFHNGRMECMAWERTCRGTKFQKWY